MFGLSSTCSTRDPILRIHFRGSITPLRTTVDPKSTEPMNLPTRNPKPEVTVDSLELMLQRYTGTLLLVSPFVWMRASGFNIGASIITYIILGVP